MPAMPLAPPRNALIRLEMGILMVRRPSADRIPGDHPLAPRITDRGDRRGKVSEEEVIRLAQHPQAPRADESQESGANEQDLTEQCEPIEGSCGQEGS